MQVMSRHRAYWSKNLRVTGALLLVWAAVSFVPVYWAREFNEVLVFGWPLAFYMGAQGAPIVYVLLIWFYARIMERLDRQYGAGGQGD